MTVLNWKKYFAVVSSVLLLLLGEQIVVACSDGGDPGDYYPSFFDNRMPSSGSFEYFRYSALTGVLYETWYDEEKYPTDTADGNRAEWAAYTGAPLADVDSFVYSYDREVLAKLYQELEKGTPARLSDSYTGNRMLKWFRKSKDLEALGYLMYAKQIQPYANAQQNDPWNPATPPDYARIEKLRKNGLQLYKAAQKPFFRERYAYQVQRLAFAAGKHREALQIYDSIGAKGNSNMASRALGLQAGSFYKLKQKAVAAYRYSLLFDRGDEFRKTAFISYGWTGADSNLTAVLKHCTNAHERAVVHVLSGLYTYGPALDRIEKALQEDPQVNGLDALVTREINKAEERYLQGKLLGGRNRIWGNEAPNAWGFGLYASPYWNESSNETNETAVQQKAIVRLASLIEQAAKGNPARAFWPIAGAYLSLVTEDRKGMETQLAAAERLHPNERERDQISVIKLLAVSREGNAITPQSEASMLPYITWLDNRRKTAPRLDKTYRDFMNAYLAGMYLKQRDTVKAIYALARAQRSWGDTGMVYRVSEDFMDEPGILLQSISNSEFEKMKAFSTAQNKSPFENWLRGNDAYTLPMLQELEGTYRLREYRFADAVAAFRKSDAKALSVHKMPDPFIFSINDYIEWDAADSATAITKLQFAERMAALQGKTDAESLLQYGIGLYSMSYYGKSHRASDYYRSGTDYLAYYADSNRFSINPIRLQYYNPTTAENFFVQAAAKAASAETRAKALFMAAKCWQKRCPEPKEGRRNWYEPGKPHPYYVYSLANPYFQQLQTQGANTAFYEQALRTCDYLRDYAKKR